MRKSSLKSPKVMINTRPSVTAESDSDSEEFGERSSSTSSQATSESSAHNMVVQKANKNFGLKRRNMISIKSNSSSKKPLPLGLLKENQFIQIRHQSQKSPGPKNANDNDDDDDRPQIDSDHFSDSSEYETDSNNANESDSESGSENCYFREGSHQKDTVNILSHEVEEDFFLNFITKRWNTNRKDKKSTKEDIKTKKYGRGTINNDDDDDNDLNNDYLYAVTSPTNNAKIVMGSEFYEDNINDDFADNNNDNNDIDDDYNGKNSNSDGNNIMSQFMGTATVEGIAGGRSQNPNGDGVNDQGEYHDNVPKYVCGILICIVCLFCTWQFYDYNSKLMSDDYKLDKRGNLKKINRNKIKKSGVSGISGVVNPYNMPRSGVSGISGVVNPYNDMPQSIPIGPGGGPASGHPHPQSQIPQHSPYYPQQLQYQHHPQHGFLPQQQAYTPPPQVGPGVAQQQPQSYHNNLHPQVQQSYHNNPGAQPGHQQPYYYHPNQNQMQYHGGAGPYQGHPQVGVGNPR